MRVQLSEASIALEKKQKENRKKLANIEKELQELQGEFKGTKGEDKKYRVKVRQLENELEQTLKKISILDKKSGSRYRSNSSTRIQKTEFKPTITRKPLNNRSNITPPSKRP